MTDSKRTFITTIPDHVGAFLKASRCIADLGLNITRVSYNKAIDLHTLFIEAEGDEEGLDLASQQLREFGYLQGHEETRQVILLEFTLPNLPGAITDVVELIGSYGFNISYMSAQADGDDYQPFKAGILVENSDRFAAFLADAAQLCPVKVLNYDKTEKILDNSVFYVSFATDLAARMGLDADSRSDLLLNANLVMHMLDDRGAAFHKTFDYIRGFADALARSRGEGFQPRITHHDFGEDLHITLIEPPCGSNTCILRHKGQYLFVDTGYACHRQEMLSLLRELIPGFGSCRKSALVTHADVDHCGLLDLFPTVYMSEQSRRSLLADTSADDFRERNPIHAPYVRICKTLTSFVPPPADIITVIGQPRADSDEPLAPVGSWQFGDLTFELYEGRGGHLPGELVLVERTHHLVFTGDILINIKELIPQQAEHNRYAPYLMTSVDTDPKLCALERKALSDVLGSGSWSLFCGHGPRKDMTVE